MTIMFIGIGFVAMLTAAMARLFVEQAVEKDVEAHEGHVLAELRRISERLDRLEQRG